MVIRTGLLCKYVLSLTLTCPEEGVAGRALGPRREDVPGAFSLEDVLERKSTHGEA